MYVTIDEIRTAVNALSSESSLTNPTTNDVQPPPVPRRVINAENENHSQVAPSISTVNELEDVADESSLQQTSSSFDVYDGPSDEPIYASVQRILSHSLVLANERENPVSEPVTETPPQEEIVESKTSVVDDNSPPLSSDEGDEFDSDTAPLI